MPVINIATNNPVSIVGSIIIVLGVILLVGGIILAAVLKKKGSEAA